MASKAQKSQQYMKFGQIIRIHGHNCIPKQNNQVREKRGMIAVKGFTDLDARYVPFENFKNCQFYRQTLFQVLPKGVFEKTDDSEGETKQIQAYKQLIKTKMGVHIKFGEDIVFKHVDSEAYLSGSVRCSDGGLGAFKVQLSNILSNNLVFRLYPFRSFEKEGDKIKLESPLRIKNISNRCYVSTEENKSKTVIKYSIVTTYSQSFTWLIHLHESHQTLHDTEKIRTHDILFLTHTHNEGYLCLQGEHRKKKTCIKLPLEDTGYPCYTCLWEIQKWSIPQVSPYPDKNLGTQGTYSLRDVLSGEYLQIYKLQQVEMSHLSQNMNSSIDSREISIKSAKGGLTLPTEYMKDKGLIKICGPKALSKFQGQLDAGELIEADPDQFSYREKSPYKINAAKYIDVESSHGFRIQKIDEQSKRQVLFVLSTYEVLNQFGQELQKNTAQFQEEINFKRLDLIDVTLQKLIAFIKNCDLKDIQEDILPERKKQFIARDLQICPILFKILDQMGIKILEQIYKKGKNQNQIFKKVFNRAYFLILQIIKNNPMTKLYVCQSWLTIILDHAIQNEEDTVHQTLNQILQNNQLVVSKFLRAGGNYLVHRIINIFTLKPPHEKFLNIFRASCMSGDAPIVGNQNLILNIFFKKLEEVAKFKFIKSVKIDVLAFNSQVEENKGFEQDRKIYLRCCISKDHQRTRSLKSFFEQSAKLDLSQTSNYFTAYLNLLADICYGRNTQAKKFVEQSLVPTRSKPVPNAPPLTAMDTLIGILQDQDLRQVKGSTNLLRAVLRLINYAFVESADQNPVLRINRYRNLNNMSKAIHQVDLKFKNVMSFIKQSLSKFDSFYTFAEIKEVKDKDKDKEIDKQTLKIQKKQREKSSIQQKQFLLTVLVLLRSTLINGYWSVFEQQVYLLPLLLKVLRNQKRDILHGKQEEIESPQKQLAEFEKFKDQASRYTPAVESIVMCKALACSLIEIIFDFRHDDLVTKCANAYNQLFQRTQTMRASASLDRNGANLLENKHKKMNNQFYDVKVWEKYLKDIFTEAPRQEDAQNKQQNKDTAKFIIPLMVQMSIHRNPVLFFRSLTILKRHFEFRFDIFKLFLNLSIYDQRNGSDLANKIQQKRNVLNKLEEQNLLYIQQPGVYNQIMNFLVWLSQSLKIDTNISYQPPFSNFKTIYDHFTQRSALNRFHQRLIKNKDLHLVLLKFIGLSRQKLSTFTPDARQVLKYIYRFLTLLVKSFKQAKLQVMPLMQKIKSHAKEECELVQKTISSSVQIDLIQIERRDDCEAIELLYELFSHNKIILYNEPYMQETLSSFCIYVNEVSINNYYKSHLLNLFRSFIYYNDKHIKVNQSKILAKLQDSKKKQIYYREEPRDPDSLSVELISSLIKEWEEDNMEIIDLVRPGTKSNLAAGQLYPVVIAPRLTYFITLFNLFANLVEGQHIVNIGKCQQVHSYDMLMSMLKSGSICYPLKIHLRNYINELYYSIGVQQDLCEPIIKMEIPLIIEDLNKIIVIICKKVQGHYYIAHPIRYKFYETYFYLYIQQIIFTLNYLFHDENFNRSLTTELSRNYSRGYYYLHYYIIRIYERLRWIVNNFYEYRYLRNFINKVTNRIKKDYLQKFRETAFRIFDRNQEKLHNVEDFNPNKIKGKVQINQVRVDALNRRSKNLLHKLIKGEIGNYFSQKRPQKDNNFPLTFVLPYEDQAEANDPTQKKHRQDELNKLAEKLKILLFAEEDAFAKKDYHHRKLIKLKESLMESQEFIEFMVHYQQNQSNQMYHIDDHSLSYYNFRQVFVSFAEYIKVFVKVNTEKPQSITTDLKIFFFKVLLQYIKRFKIQNKLRPVQLWTKEDWNGHENQIVQNQNFLKKSNVAELFIQALKKSEDIHLFSSIMHFGIAFVLRGNTQCQNALLQMLYEDKKNEVFIKLQRQISRLGKKITSRISEQTMRKIPTKEEFVVESLDLYDFYDSKLNVMKKMVTMQTYLKDENDQDETDKQVFTRTFRFLQFLCQNNNIKAKHFVREQVDSKGTKNSYSFNMINITTFQIRRLFKVMNKQASKLIMPLIDFLNEVVTIPVVQNQMSLCQTTFFEDLCYMASFFKSEQNLKQRGLFEQQANQQLFTIYHKCIDIILNVLQGNNPNMLRELTIKLDVTFLLTVIERNLRKLKIHTVEEFKTLLYNEDKQQKQVPIEIQIAMNVMVVIEKLLESENADKIKQRMSANLTDIKKTLEYDLEALLGVIKSELRKIQIVSSQGKQSIFFPNHPILTKLSPTTRDRIMVQVSRTTQREKIRSLFEFKDQIIAQINHNFEIEKQKFLGISFQPSKIQKFQTWSFQLSHLINFVWFFSVDVIIEYQEVIYHNAALYDLILFGMDVFQLIITTIYLISYTKCKFALAAFRAKQAESKSKQEKSANFIEATMMMADEGRLSEKQSASKSKNIITTISTVLFAIWTALLARVNSSSLMIILKYDEKFIYVLSYFIASVLGTFYYQGLFLLYIIFFFMENDTLSNVFNAIVYNLKQLLSVSLLGVVFVYVFSLIFFETYSLQLMENTNQDDACDGILDCIMDLYVSGAIGGSVQKFQLLRFTTDMIWFVFFGLLFGNIVSGIMIETFAELRAKRQRMYDDKKNMCYICGQDRGSLEKNNEDFDYHITTKHFLWNYIFYMYCLGLKDKNNFSGLQNQINHCISSSKGEQHYISWVPFQSQGEQQHGQKIAQLTNEVEKLNKQSEQKIINMQKMLIQAMTSQNSQETGQQ